MSFRFHTCFSIILTAALFIVLSMQSCVDDRKRQNGSVSETVRLKEKGLNALHFNHFTVASAVADSLINIGETNPKNIDALIYGNIIKGQATMFTGDFEQSYPSLHKAEKLCLIHNNDSALASTYNGLGLYAMDIEQDNNEALRYFFSGIDAAKRSGNDGLHSILLCNVASVYYLTENPMGLRYALECYNRGKLTNDPMLRYAGGLTSAQCYMLQGDYSQAMKFVKEAEMVMRTNEIKNGASLYTVYGMILRKLGMLDDAEKTFRDAIRFAQEEEETLDVRSYVQLSEMMAEKKQYNNALTILDSALRRSERSHEVTFRLELLDALVRINHLAGNFAKANEFERMKLIVSDSVTSIEKATAIEQLRAKYDMERVENEVNRQRVEILEKQKQIYLLVFVAAIIVGVLIVLMMFYRHKSRLQGAIVVQLTEAVKEEKRLRETIRKLDSEVHRVNSNPAMEEECTSATSEESTVPPADGNTTSSLPSGLYERLQADIESLMLDTSVFTNNLINKDKLACRLGTNRTYLSRFINDHYKMSFTQFINSLRIKEAIRILSDPTVDISMKALSEQLGFNSQTTFYSKFSETTGLTPAVFRDKARSIVKDKGL